MTTKDLAAIRQIVREELTELLKPKKLPFDQGEFERAVRGSKNGGQEYFKNHELPDQVKYAS
jgi:hypothetical protein